MGENSTRSLLYVAMSRGRNSNTAHVYERPIEHDYLLCPTVHPTYIPWRLS